MEIALDTTKIHMMSYRALKPFQGDLKSLTDQRYNDLKNQILGTGLAFPFFAWYENETETWWTIDGHQRLRVLERMEIEGEVIPHIPVISIKAKSKKQALIRVLQANSSYGQMTPESLHEFIETNEIQYGELKEIPQDQVKYDDFVNNFYLQSFPEKDLDENIDTNKECPKCGYAWS